MQSVGETQTMKKAASIFLLFALACFGAQNNLQPKISPDLAATDSLSTTRVIVQWTVPISAATAAKIASYGGTVVSEFVSLRQGVYLIQSSQVADLSADPMVKYISLDRVVRKKLSTTAATIGAPQVWSAGYKGTGIGVAIIDSGVNKDLNLGASPKTAVAYVQDFTPYAYVNGKKSASYGLDWYGHGQHIAGIIASNGFASSSMISTQSMVGIASGATLIDLKVLDSQGEGTDSQVIAAIDRAIALKSTYNIRVINLSLGRPVYESYTVDPLCQAAEAAWQSGIVVVVAAGNDGRDNSQGTYGYGTVAAPGNDPYVLTVGSMKTFGTPSRADDLVASYSSKGPTVIDHISKPDIVAPGNLIVSLLAQNGNLPNSYPSNAVTTAFLYGAAAPTAAPVGGTPQTDPTKQPPQVFFGVSYSTVYYTMSGTSMAAAVVSGAVADILQAHPTFTPDQVKILLMETATKTFPTSSTVVDSLGNTYTDYYDSFTVGAGYLDLQGAMNQAANVPATGNSLSPTTSYDPTSGNITMSFDPASAWLAQPLGANRCLWNYNSVWSASELTASQVVFGARCLWGASFDQPFRCLWGLSSPWSQSSTANQSTLGAADTIQLTGEN